MFSKRARFCSSSLESVCSSPSALASADSSYFLGHFERTPVENTWHNVTVYQDSDGRLWWENEAGAVWELVWTSYL